MLLCCLHVFSGEVVHPNLLPFKKFFVIYVLCRLCIICIQASYQVCDWQIFPPTLTALVFNFLRVFIYLEHL